jgi:hypothetical protein
VAETSGLLNRRRGITPTEGSNPSVSAKLLMCLDNCAWAIVGSLEPSGHVVHPLRSSSTFSASGILASVSMVVPVIREGGTFITMAARNIGRFGGSLRDVRALARHSSLAMTQRYIEVDSDAMAPVVDAW